MSWWKGRLQYVRLHGNTHTHTHSNSKNYTNVQMNGELPNERGDILVPTIIVASYKE